MKVISDKSEISEIGALYYVAFKTARRQIPAIHSYPLLPSSQHTICKCRGAGRRRRFEGEDLGPRMKRLRGPPSFRGRTEKPMPAYPRERMRERSPVYRSVPRREGSSYNGTSSHKLTYQDFMREMRDFHTRAPSNLPPMAFPPPPPFDPIGPPRYYDGPPLPDYPTSRSRSEKRPSSDPYDRSVDEFLQRTRERRDRSRERRYRERR